MPKSIRELANAPRAIETTDLFASDYLGVGGDTFKVTGQAVIDFVNANIAIPTVQARNGLNVNGGFVELGGTLTQALTEVDADGNDFEWFSETGGSYAVNYTVDQTPGANITQSLSIGSDIFGGIGIQGGALINSYEDGRTSMIGSFDLSAVGLTQNMAGIISNGAGAEGAMYFASAEIDGPGNSGHMWLIRNVSDNTQGMRANFNGLQLGFASGAVFIPWNIANGKAAGDVVTYNGMGGLTLETPSAGGSGGNIYNTSGVFTSTFRELNGDIDGLGTSGFTNLLFRNLESFRVYAHNTAGHPLGAEFQISDSNNTGLRGAFARNVDIQSQLDLNLIGGNQVYISSTNGVGLQDGFGSWGNDGEVWTANGGGFGYWAPAGGGSNGIYGGSGILGADPVQVSGAASTAGIRFVELNRFEVQSDANIDLIAGTNTTIQGTTNALGVAAGNIVAIGSLASTGIGAGDVYMKGINTDVHCDTNSQLRFTHGSSVTRSEFTLDGSTRTWQFNRGTLDFGATTFLSFNSSIGVGGDIVGNVGGVPRWIDPNTTINTIYNNDAPISDPRTVTLNTFPLTFLGSGSSLYLNNDSLAGGFITDLSGFVKGSIGVGGQPLAFVTVSDYSAIGGGNYHTELGVTDNGSNTIGNATFGFDMNSATGKIIANLAVRSVLGSDDSIVNLQNTSQNSHTGDVYTTLKSLSTTVGNPQVTIEADSTGGTGVPLVDLVVKDNAGAIFGAQILTTGIDLRQGGVSGWVLPNAPGTSGQFLQTNGLGNTASWATPPNTNMANTNLQFDANREHDTAGFGLHFNNSTGGATGDFRIDMQNADMSFDGFALLRSSAAPTEAGNAGVLLGYHTGSDVSDLMLQVSDTASGGTYHSNIYMKTGGFQRDGLSSRVGAPVVLKNSFGMIDYADDGYSGTFDPNTITSITVVEGRITAVA